MIQKQINVEATKRIEDNHELRKQIKKKRPSILNLMQKNLILIQILTIERLCLCKKQGSYFPFLTLFYSLCLSFFLFAPTPPHPNPHFLYSLLPPILFLAIPPLIGGQHGKFSNLITFSRFIYVLIMLDRVFLLHFFFFFVDIHFNINKDKICCEYTRSE